MRRIIHLCIAGMITVFLDVHAPVMLAAQAKPLIKVVAGYGSTDGAIAPLCFAKETKLFEKRGLDVRLVGKDTAPVPMPTRRTSSPRFSNSLVSLANHKGAMAPSVEP